MRRFVLRRAAVHGYFQRVRTGPIAIALCLAALAAGCAHVVTLPPQVTVAEVEPSGRAAKDPNCSMPILRSDPLTDYRKIAIIEGTGNVFGSEGDVMPVVMRKACEAGADAIVILTSKAQTSENLTGYYINAVAIVFTPNKKTISAAPKSVQP